MNARDYIPFPQLYPQHLRLAIRFYYHILGFLEKPSMPFRKKHAGAARARLFCEFFFRVPKEPEYILRRGK